MEPVNKTIITVETTANASIEKVWKLWITPSDIIKWNTPSDDWHTPRAENDLRPGGRFVSHMAARDGSMSFDFGGTYDDIKAYELILYTIDDGLPSLILHHILKVRGKRVQKYFFLEQTVRVKWVAW